MLTRAKIEACHTAYCQATKYELPLSIDREMAWVEWLRRGLTTDDVVTLVRHHKRLASTGGNARSLKFRSLVLNVDWAEEDLAEIKAAGRGPERQPNRESVLRATDRPERPEPPEARPSKEVVENMLAQLRQAATGEGNAQ